MAIYDTKRRHVKFAMLHSSFCPSRYRFSMFWLMFTCFEDFTFYSFSKNANCESLLHGQMAPTQKGGFGMIF